VDSRSFPGHPPSVPAARHYVTAVLGQVPTELSDVAGLLVSELATNAVRHAEGQFEVAVRFTAELGRLWIGVTDTGPGSPVLQVPPVSAERGRGLQLVSTLADRWGMRRRRGTAEKTVWFELTTGPTDATLPATPGAAGTTGRPLVG
jgi:anti-sigma regulatory factor (Ser/Thr protein kinase)